MMQQLTFSFEPVPRRFERTWNSMPCEVSDDWHVDVFPNGHTNVCRWEYTEPNGPWAHRIAVSAATEAEALKLAAKKGIPL